MDRRWPVGSVLDRVLPFVAAISLVVLGYVLRSLLQPALGDRSQFILFVPAVLLSAIYLGRQPALLSAILSLFAGVSLFPAAVVNTTPAQVQALLFIIEAFGVVWLAEHVATARRTSDQHKQEAEEEARISRQASESFDLLLQGAREYAIFMVDEAGKVSLWNSGAQRMYGWEEKQILGKPSTTFYPAEEAAAGKAHQDLFLALQQGSYSTEHLQVRGDGSRFLGEVTITPLKTGSGQLRGFAKLVRDITERRALASALERREQHLRSILSTIPDAMVVVDKTGSISSFSAVAERLFGYAEADVVGSNVSILSPPEYRDYNQALVSHYIQTANEAITAAPHYLRGCRADGTTFPMKLTICEVATEEELLFTGFVEDLTEKRRFEKEVERLQSELTHAARLTAMGTMASTLAHELNQPLTAIASFAEAAELMLDKPDVDKKAVKHLLRDLSAQSFRAGQIVRRLRDFVKRGHVRRSDVNLTSLIDEAATLALIGTRERGIETSFSYEQKPVHVLADKVQIQQVLINLIRNAIEAMENSAVRKLTINTASAGRDMVCVSVSDTGRGLDSEAAAHLFTAFESSKPDGMGLGLSICRTIVEAHGGRINVSPADSQGTKFEFTLPLSKRSRDAAKI
ncbi:MAG TPA: PAS domain S-box protein [Allosphingosinicella sp.]|uniref:PAS domain S-box protein n=1 Tax=Allosphingosinicella sp. TaxID=2823234 RepID=UPI002ED9843F